MIQSALAILSVLAFGAVPAAPSLAQAASPAARVVVVSATRASYRAAADALEAALRREEHDPYRIDLPEDADSAAYQDARQRLVEAKPTVIAAAGPAATSFALDAVPKVPVVFFLVPNVLDAPFMNNEAQRQRLTGVAADIAPDAQVTWIRQLRPSAKHIAVLYSARTERTVQALVDAGLAKGLAVVPIPADKGDFPSAIDRLNATGCDGALMIPDANVYTSATVQRLLLWGVRGKKPVWSFSPNIVKAGAFAGLYTQYEEVGRQAASLVVQCASGKSPENLGLQYPQAVTRAVNKRIAATIDMPLDDPTLGPSVVRLGDGK